MRSPRWFLWLMVAFFTVPIGFLALQPPVYVGDGAPRIVEIAAFALALLLTTAAGAFFLLGVVRMPVFRSRQRRRLTYVAIACGLLALVLIILLSLHSPLFGLVFALIVAFYLTFTLPTSRRRVGYRNTVTVRCAPEAAYAFISNPRNWPQYEPHVQILEPLDTPLRLGSVVTERVTIGTAFVDGQEEVTLMEPNRRLGMRVVDSELRAFDLYEFRPVEGGTEIAYTVEHRLTVAEAVCGGVLSRRTVTRWLQSRREVKSQRIKEILEAPPAATV